MTGRGGWARRGQASSVARLLVSSLAVACADGRTDVRDASPEVVTPRQFEARLGVIDDDGAFAPLSGALRVPLVQGFQGLMHVDLAIETGALDIAGTFEAVGFVDFVDVADRSFSFVDHRLVFDPPVAGRRSAQLRVPFGQDVALLHGRRLTVDVELVSAPWSAATAGACVVYDAYLCEHELDDAGVCP